VNALSIRRILSNFLLLLVVVSAVLSVKDVSVLSEQLPVRPFGVQRMLVIPVDFTDEKATVPISNFKEMVNQMDIYLQEVSYGQTSLEADVFEEWVKLPKPSSYYGRDAEQPGDDHGGNGRGSLQLVFDAVKEIDGQIDFTRYAQLIVVHAGDDQAEINPNSLDDSIWSFSYWDISISTNDGIAVTRTSIVSEESPLGVWIHEYLHQLAELPDLWNTQDGEEHYVGIWSPMDRGISLGVPRGSSPPHPISWSKIQMGWLEPLILTHNDTTLTISPLEESTGGFTQAVVVPLPDGTYYLIEVREQIGFDSALPAEGVLIYHINEMTGEPEVRIMPRQDDDPLKRGASYRAGDMFFDDVYDLSIEVDSKAFHGYTVRITYAADQHLTLEVPNHVSAFQPFTATVKLLNATVDPKLNLFFDDVLYRAEPKPINGEYQVTLQLGFDQIGEHVIRAIVVDPVEGTRSEVATRVFVEIPYTQLIILGAVALALVLAFIVLLIRRHRRSRDNGYKF
jgi:M6 family metalloprotease-like protein